MFLSVSIPIYNAEKYLDECISSIMNQTETDFELVLVNDGSKDSSLDICYKWAKKYSNIRVIDNPNQGSLLTRRTCIKESRGDYLYIMDADDYLLDDDAFFEFRKFLEGKNIDMLFFDYRKGSKEKSVSMSYPFSGNDIFDINNKNVIYELVVKTKRMNSLWNKVFSRDIVDFDEDYDNYREVCVGTDFFQVLPIITRASRIGYLKKELYFYRETEGSIVHKFNPKLADSLETNQRWLEKHVLSWNLPGENSHVLLANRYMISVSTTINKAKLIQRNDMNTRFNFIKTIGNGLLFRERYLEANKADLSLPRCVIVWMLYHRWYGLLSLIYFFIGIFN